MAHAAGMALETVPAEFSGMVMKRAAMLSRVQENKGALKNHIT